MSANLQSTPAMTAAGFLAVADDAAGRRQQLVDGELVLMAPASRTHARIQAALGGLLNAHLAAQGGPCQVFTTLGVQPHAQAEWNVRVPDLAVDCDPPDPQVHLCRNPVVIVEILSPSNARQTRSNVWAYMSIPSVREILLLHGDALRGELLRRDPVGGWPAAPARLLAGDTLTLTSIGFAAPLAAAYAGIGLPTELPPAA